MALVGLPRDEIIVAEDAWTNIQEKNRTIGMYSFIKVPEERVAAFERLSGQNGVFLRCIQRHRGPVEQAPPPISWIPQL
eukprot:14761804-Alexandrium_andersonii.AAC.1